MDANQLPGMLMDMKHQNLLPNIQPRKNQVEPQPNGSHHRDTAPVNNQANAEEVHLMFEKYALRDEYLQFVHKTDFNIAHNIESECRLPDLLDNISKTVKILWPPGVCEGDLCAYDITNIVPPYDSNFTSNTRDADLKKPSHLEILLDLQDPRIAYAILDQQPFRAVESALALLTSSCYTLLLVLHLALMIIFCTVFYNYMECRKDCLTAELNEYINTNCSLFVSDTEWDSCYKNKLRHVQDTSNTIACAWCDFGNTGTGLFYAFVLSEPFILWIFYFTKLVPRFQKILRETTEKKPVVPVACLQHLRGILQAVFNTLSALLPLLLVTVYFGCVIAAVVLHLTKSRFLYVAFAMSSSLGWMYTITLTRGLNVGQHLWKIIYTMIVKDVLPFLFCFVFVYVGFSFAFHAVYQMLPYFQNSRWHNTAFRVFRMLSGDNKMYDDDYLTAVSTTMSPGEEMSDINMLFGTLYIIYFLVASVLLLNMLIAMMQKSYKDTLKTQQLHWRIEDLKTAMGLIKVFPRLLGLCVTVRKEMAGTAGRPDGEDNRWCQWFIDIAQEDPVRTLYRPVGGPAPGQNRRVN